MIRPLRVLALACCAPRPRGRAHGLPARRVRRAPREAGGWRVQQRPASSCSAPPQATPGLRFRQDNDFFYLTGNESLNGVLVIDAATKASHLFLPKLTPSQIRYEGGNWLDEPDAAKAHGFTSIQPITALGEFLGRRRGSVGPARRSGRASPSATTSAPAASTPPSRPAAAWSTRSRSSPTRTPRALPRCGCSSPTTSFAT